MRLKQIKLAGFKSFVDKTKVTFEHDMTAIVGPNGCGKSNVIDAVRWVLGESSAKNLRGDAMTDVIFNGATSRKPVGQASVELVFENMAGHFQGSLADRNEISIRRVVNRDSQSSYFLNGSKCRRKDITDIFLGTGLGPRSYAIIEQGTISRLIESKPQELRTFIEEAAGISKYKERRKDTENRIRHTRENLDRLNDIRVELAHQLEHLYGQAQAAKRFKILKTEERLLKAELAYLKWQKHAEQFTTIEQTIKKIQTEITSANQSLSDHELSLFTVKQTLKNATSEHQAIQNEKLDLAQKIAANEQAVKHRKQQIQKYQSDALKARQQLEKTQELLALAQQELSHCRQSNEHGSNESIEQLASALRQLEKEVTQVQVKQQNVYQAWQKDLEFQRNHQQKRESLLATIEKLSTTKDYLFERISIVTKQYKTLTDNNNKERETRYECQEEQDQLDELEQQLETIEHQLNEVNCQQQAAAQNKGSLLGREKSHQAQIEQLEKRARAKLDWQVEQRSFVNKLLGSDILFSDKIDVEPGWEKATELVLHHFVNANIFPSEHFRQLLEEELPEVLRLLVVGNDSLSTIEANDRQSLAAKVHHQDPEVNKTIQPILAQILLANDLDEALRLREILTPEQSIVTKHGEWLGQHFIIKGQPVNTNHSSLTQGVIEQKNELLVLEQSLDQLKKQLSSLNEQEQQYATFRDKLLDTRNQLTSRYNHVKQIVVEKQKQAAVEQEKQLHNTEKSEALRNELASLQQRYQTTIVSLREHEEQYSHFTSHSDVSESDSELTLEQQYHVLAQQLTEFQLQREQLQHQKHQLELNVEQNKQQLQHAVQHVQRHQENLAKEQAHLEIVDKELQQLVAPLENEERLLNQQIDQYAQVELKLNDLVSEIEVAEHTLEQHEQTKHKLQRQIEQFNNNLSQQRLSMENARLKMENTEELMTELGHLPDELEKNLPSNASEGQWQIKLTRTTKQLSELGAINLAAIDEYNQQITRKNYLDQQDEDLNLAISTLESAIVKIDRESRHKFKLTFDQVNQDLQTLFPKVFGGGTAYLMLTGDDLLETGVTIMARPPGKKNSTIHLLSGGEKALTALSLVFAIFRLNPAPFCMLDEVDAPLDDANVGRFCNLVREMSQTVQFIYISHNKIAMEMASHLTGVTMFEAGVSRVVSVDVDEAIAMADVS
ncbi:chromosome segregation protein SMC [Thalassotalea ganghwensis]